MAENFESGGSYKPKNSLHTKKNEDIFENTENRFKEEENRQNRAANLRIIEEKIHKLMKENKPLNTLYKRIKKDSESKKWIELVTKFSTENNLEIDQLLLNSLINNYEQRSIEVNQLLSTDVSDMKMKILWHLNTEGIEIDLEEKKELMKRIGLSDQERKLLVDNGLITHYQTPQAIKNFFLALKEEKISKALYQDEYVGIIGIFSGGAVGVSTYELLEPFFKTLKINPPTGIALFFLAVCLIATGKGIIARKERISDIKNEVIEKNMKIDNIRSMIMDILRS